MSEAGVVTRRIRAGKLELALHTLREGSGRALLWLHGLGERSPDALPELASGWPGPVYALDFTGHGDSEVPAGGGYSAELLMGDVDAALHTLGEATLLGRGLGAYAALLIAGGRPTRVRGAILCDGHGITGGGPEPGGSMPIGLLSGEGTAPDPFALVELSRDPRPPDYATTFVRQANELSGLSRPITVCCRERPEWLRAVEGEPGVERAEPEEALAYYAGL
ncbi:MAG: alpha/beta hydrolase [Myxococcota bacterium]|nr:alpha/beta hydrolase [Myxococcota bacterium]